MGLLASGLAHDFNNLLTGINGYIELAMEEIGDRPTALLMLKNAVEAGMRARDLCTQVLSHVRQGDLQNETVDLHLLIRDAVSLVSIASKRVKFHLQLCAVPSIASGSAVEFRQILMNLLINATEAMNGRGENVWIDTNHLHVKQGDLRPIAPGEYIELRLRDDGQGMSPETRERIFEPFFTTKPKGTGIGLSTVRRIMRGHGGSVEVESAMGEGTTFTLLFPLQDVDLENASEKPRWKKTGRVLVVDDESSLAELIAHVLSTHGLTVDVANGGEAALRFFRETEKPYLAVMLDLTMPGMDGAATLSALREAGLKAPVILMSGLERNLALYRIAEGEYASFLRKPFGPASVVAAVRSVLEPSYREELDPMLTKGD